MKKLKKIILSNKSDVLNDLEMKLIIGGYDGSIGGGLFRCGCSIEGANPPFKTTWMAYYTSTKQMQDDINRICVSRGSCNSN